MIHFFVIINRKKKKTKCSRSYKNQKVSNVLHSVEDPALFSTAPGSLYKGPAPASESRL